jgi:excisionase family DNA binding protein
MTIAPDRVSRDTGLGGAIRRKRRPRPHTNRGNTLTDDSQDQQQRRRLLGMLFGSEVPAALEGQLLRTSDVAVLFQVSERTVSEWAKRGQIPSVRTPGGHRRYPAEGIRWLLQESRNGPPSSDDIQATVTQLPHVRTANG